MSARLPVDAERVPVRILTLGRFAILQGGKPLRFGRKAPSRPLALLKFLAAHGGEAPDVKIAAGLWPGTGAAGLKSVAVNLHRLRRLLADAGALVCRDRRLAFDPQRVWWDALAFEHLLDHAESASRAQECIRFSQRALALYRGDFLCGEDFQPWMAPMRERLRGRFLAATACLGQRLATAGRWQEARICYQRGLAIDELAEDLCLGLMACLAALQRPVEGVTAYRRFERSLAARPGVAPASATRALYRRLLHQGS